MPGQLLFLLLLLLGGCFGGGHYAPVIERRERAEVIPESHTVARGETLYSISWRYSMDFRGLARTNGIGSPYTIYPGQVIRIKPRVKSPAKGSRQTSQNTSNVMAKGKNGKPKPVVSSAPVKVAVAKAKVDQRLYPFRWQWPSSGSVSRRYSSSSALHKGIDIKGKLGEPVHAANSGKVVYAGSGLVGYGKLLIIKHDEHYLSAYGHNNKLLVDEGELVKVGQKIAEFGDTGTDKVKLHFEIRRDGKPVNPLSLLPRGKVSSR